jgi:tRNA(adenine34) deaminase
LDRVPPSEGGGCPFEPGREQIDAERVLRRAIALAAEAAAGGDVPIGAVLVVGEHVIETQNEKERRPDPTAHAEMLALREAAQRLGSWRIGGTLYVTKEPCPMCAGAMAAARIERLVYGCADPKGGAAGSVIDILGSAAVNHRVAVTAGVLEEETADQLRSYFRNKRVERWSSG